MRVERVRRAVVAAELARLHDGVVHRRDLRAAGIDRHDVRTEVRARRWSVLGVHTVAVGGVPAMGRARLWWAVWESGPGAALDGAAALVAAGMTGFSLDVIDVVVPNRNRGRALLGVRVRSRREVGPVIGAGLVRTRPEWATIRAAQWAASERTAALLICLPVQQRIVLPDRLLHAWASVRRSPRRVFLNRVLRDVCDGAHSLGELDFSAICRRHAVPVPTRQVLREGGNGRYYLDAFWEGKDVVVEIDGSQHVAGLNPVDDALRQNDLTLGSARVLRIPLLGLRLAPEKFMAQVKRLLEAT